MSTYKYFANGQTIEIEIGEEWFNLLREMDHEEMLSNRKETRRHTSLESFVSEDGEDYPFASDDDVEGEVLNKEDQQEHEVTLQHLREALSTLTPEQQGLVDAIYYQNMKITDYATAQGVTHPAISQRKATVIKALKKKLL